MAADMHDDAHESGAEVLDGLGLDLEPDAPVGPPVALTADHRHRMIRFLRLCLTELGGENLALLGGDALDPRDRFGLQLVLAGAAERYGANLGLKNLQKFVLMREALEGLGLAPDDIDVFCRDFLEHDSEPASRALTDAGRRFMDMFADGSLAWTPDLPDVLAAWRESETAITDPRAAEPEPEIGADPFVDLPKPPPAAPPEMTETPLPLESGAARPLETVMVTDIIDATRGSVRHHNAIVRQCLAEFHGTEVGHTDTGIVARFTNTGNALRAARRMQRRFAEHNTVDPEFAVFARIGFDIGEAEPDAAPPGTGPVVRGAARMCAEAGGGDIYVTELVRRRVDGQAFDFESRGEYAPGGGTAIPLHALAWRQTGS